MARGRYDGALTPPPAGRVGLLSLPVETLDLIIQYVALLRLEYSESRRPEPSALHHLAYGTNRLLRTLALPYLFRTLETTKAPPDVWLPGAGLVSAKRFARTIRYIELRKDDLMYQYSRIAKQRRADKKERLVFYEYTALNQVDFPKLECIALRHVFNKDFLPRVVERSPRGRNSTTVSVRTMDIAHMVGVREEQLLPFAATVESLSLSLNILRLGYLLPQFTALRTLALNDQFDPLGDLETAKYLELPPSARLRHLYIRCQLCQLPFPLFRHEAHSIETACTLLIHSFGAVPLKTLSLDDGMVCMPVHLAKLADAFPTLRSFTLGDRTVWDGSRADILAALSGFRHLTTLCLRLPSITPSSPYDKRLNPSSPSNNEDAYASPAAIACEAAEIVPTLHHVGFSGQSNSVEWFRICRDDEGRPESAEGVTFYSTDLDKP